MGYGYTCDRVYGPTTGSAIIAFGADGSIHRLIVSALDPYWEAHRDSLEQITYSLTATKE